MRSLVAVSLVVSSALGQLSFGQQAVAPASVTPSISTSPAVPAGVVPAPPAPVAPNTLQDGTLVKLRISENLSSAHARTGQSVAFEVVEDVLVQGIVVLPKGAQALATVTEASSKKSMGRGGKLDVNVDSARLGDGEKVQLRAVQENKGGGHTAVMTGAIVATAIVFFPAAPLFLFIHGKDITIPEGTQVNAFVQGDMKLDLAKFAPAVPAITAASVATSGLTIEASVPNCDIDVDGSFVGSTPSTLNLPAGKHEVRVKKAGYQDWTRSMMVSTGVVRVSADMIAVK